MKSKMGVHASEASKLERPCTYDAHVTKGNICVRCFSMQYSTLIIIRYIASLVHSSIWRNHVCVRMHCECDWVQICITEAFSYRPAPLCSGSGSVPPIYEKARRSTAVRVGAACTAMHVCSLTISEVQHWRDGSGDFGKRQKIGPSCPHVSNMHLRDEMKPISITPSQELDSFGVCSSRWDSRAEPGQS